MDIKTIFLIIFLLFMAGLAYYMYRTLYESWVTPFKDVLEEHNKEMQEKHDNCNTITKDDMVQSS